MAMPLSDPTKEGEDIQSILRGEILTFLHDFEASEKGEGDMKRLLSLWKSKLLTHAQTVGGDTKRAIELFLTVCEDYAGCKGMLERVKREAEELRICLGL